MHGCLAEHVQENRIGSPNFPQVRRSVVAVLDPDCIPGPQTLVPTARTFVPPWTARHWHGPWATGRPPPLRCVGDVCPRAPSLGRSSSPRARAPESEIGDKTLRRAAHSSSRRLPPHMGPTPTTAGSPTAERGGSAALSVRRDSAGHRRRPSARRCRLRLELDEGVLHDDVRRRGQGAGLGLGPAALRSPRAGRRKRAVRGVVSDTCVRKRSLPSYPVAPLSTGTRARA